MNRTLFVGGVLVVVVLALFFVACGSDSTSTPVATAPPPAATAAAPSAPGTTTTVPATVPTVAPTAAPAVSPTAAPTAAPTRAAATPEVAEEVDGSEAYFALDRVLEVSIEIDEGDWDTLRHQTRTFEDLMAEIEKYELSRPFASIYDWFSATVTIDGEGHTEVGVRKKGLLGSQSDTKPSLKLRYDKYVDGQSLGGVMERMALNNSVQDPSMINTCLAYQVFAAAGNPAPRCNFATVTVNGRELGLYVHVEEIKRPFLARHFDSAEGNLYEGTVSDFTPEYRGTMEKKTNEEEDDWSDVEAVMAALQDPSESGLEALGEWVDLDRFLSFWATEVLVGHWDGYVGDRNNYHFYRQREGKFVFIPWGVDDTFHLKEDPNPFDNISNPPPSVLALTAIPNRLYNHPEWRGKYAARLKEVLDTAWDEEALLARVEEMAAIVQEHGLPEERAKAAEDTDRVRKFILKRRGEILADLTPEPPHWPEPYAGSGGGTRVGESAFEVHFETTWGSNSSPNPLEEGRVTYLFSEDGVETGERLEWMGVIAGEASAEEQAVLPGVTDLASIIVMMFLPESGEVEGVTVVLPRELLADGAVLTLGEDPIGGGVWGIPAGAAAPEWFEPLSWARLELDMAGTEEGAVISGQFYGSTGEAGDTGPAVDESAFEVHFETTWGSNGGANPLEEGRVTYLLSEDGVQTGERLERMGVIAGEASAEEQAVLPGVADLASITVMMFLPESGEIEGVTVVLPRELLADEAVLTLGEDPIGGVVWGIPAGAAAPEWFEPLSGAQLELDMAGTEPGDIISGRFYGRTGEAGDTGPAVDESAFEVHFETTWGSNGGANPLEEGRVTYLLSEDGVQTGERLEWMGVTAGEASAEEQAVLPGVADLASITVMMFLPESGEVEGVTVVLPRELLADGAVLTLGEDPIGGVVWGIPAGAAAPEWFEPLSWARLELDMAGTEEGTVISGRFTGRTGEAGETGPAVDESVFEFHFETTWGSNGGANPLEEGRVTYLLSEDRLQKGERLEWMGVIAGEASAEEQAVLPGVADLASITVMMFLPESGDIEGVTVVLPRELLADGAVLTLGEDPIGGGVWGIPAGAAAPEWFEPLSWARLELDMAGTEEGAVISGRFTGRTGEGAGPEPKAVETEGVKIRFEAYWGSKLSDNPLMEGKIYERNESGKWVSTAPGEAGATAGEATAEEAADIGVAEAAVITVMGVYPDLTVQGFTFWMPIDRVVAGAKLVIGADAGVGGAIWRIPAGAMEPGGFIPITAGGIELTEGGTEPGDLVSGVLYFSIGDAELTDLEGGGDVDSSTPSAAAVTGLVINEVAAKGDPRDWFELYNTGDSEIALSGLVVADDLGGTGKRVAFPSGMTIAPGEYLRIEVDSDNWAGFGLGSEEELGIWTSEGVLVDSVDWASGEAGEGESYSRLPDGTGEFHTVVPTPGYENEHHH